MTDRSDKPYYVIIGKLLPGSQGAARCPGFPRLASKHFIRPGDGRALYGGRKAIKRRRCRYGGTSEMAEPVPMGLARSGVNRSMIGFADARLQWRRLEDRRLPTTAVLLKQARR